MNSVREEMDIILDEGLQAALPLLEKNGEFFPFALAMSLAGDIRIVAGYTGDEHPESNDVIDVLRQGLRKDARKGKIKTSAIVSDVRVRAEVPGDMTDAIRVQIEHVDGAPVACFQEYRLRRKKVEQGKLTAQDDDSHVFK